MSNHENLIRPSILNERAAEQAAARPINMEDLNAIIANATTAILERQLPNLSQTIINQSTTVQVVTDQVIEERYRGNFQELDKIPDIAKCLREFSGNNGEFNSWRKSVERILQIYESSKGTPKYYGILNVIRNKIVGSADIALESYNTPLDWGAICKCLCLHYADKRDLTTLEYQMTSLVQGRLTVEEFYQAVYKHLSLILNKIGCLEHSNESLSLLTQTYRDKALDTFIRGLNGDLPMLLGMKEPSDLPQALHLCQKLANQTFRTSYANNNSYSNRKLNFYPATPSLPPRNYQRNYQQNNTMPFTQNQNKFYPQIAHIPQANQIAYTQRQNNYVTRNDNPTRQQPNAFFQQSIPPRPSAPKTQPQPEPMDIDESLRTRRIDYMNRPGPQQTFNKRPPPPASNSNFQPKIQRNYHIDDDSQAYNEFIETVNEESGNALNEYIDEIEDSYDSNDVIECNDIHFLE